MDLSLVKDIGVFLSGGLVIGPISYLLKRRIERRADHEDLELTERLLKVNRELKDQRLTANELSKLQLTLRRGQANTAAPSATVELIETRTATIPEKIITQAEMNESSYEDFEAAELAMQQALRRLQSILNGESLAELDASQATWKDYRDKQVSFAGGFYRGGSIVSLIHNSEAASLTNARAKDLRAVYDELQSK